MILVFPCDTRQESKKNVHRSVSLRNGIEVGFKTQLQNKETRNKYMAELRPSKYLYSGIEYLIGKSLELQPNKKV